MGNLRRERINKLNINYSNNYFSMILSKNPIKAKKVLNGFLTEFDILSELKHSVGYDILDNLDKRICMAIESIFPNDKNKIDQYKHLGSPSYFMEKMVTRSFKPSPNKERDDFIVSIKAKKNYISGLITQIDLIPNNEKNISATTYIAIGLFLFGLIILFMFNQYFGGFLILLSMVLKFMK